MGTGLYLMEPLAFSPNFCALVHSLILFQESLWGKKHFFRIKFTEEGVELGY